MILKLAMILRFAAPDGDTAQHAPVAGRQNENLENAESA
jgi:hypothetical protein